MNIEEKTKLAHDWFMSMVSAKAPATVATAWKYADQMEVEAEKRIKAKAEKDAKDAKVFFEELTKNKDGSCAHFHTTLNKAECFDCGFKLQDEFQVDWSVAPEWASYWIKTSGKSYAWLSDKPEISEIIPHWNIECIQKTFAPSFGYQGDWKDSLRKRPQEKPKQHDCNCEHWKGSSFFMGDTFTCKDCGGSVTI